MQNVTVTIPTDKRQILLAKNAFFLLDGEGVRLWEHVDVCTVLVVVVARLPSIYLLCLGYFATVLPACTSKLISLHIS